MNNFYNNNGMMGQQMPQMTRQNPYFNSSNLAPSNNIIWVQGIEGAKAWQLNPNSRAILLDSEIEGKMYIKICDEIGISSLRIFNYKEEEQPLNNNIHNSNENPLDLSQYVKKDELAQMIKEILNEQSISTVNTTTTTTNKTGAIPSEF